MLSLFKEVISQGGIFFSFVLSSLDSVQHRSEVEKGLTRYTSCMYLFTSHPKCFCNVK